MTTKYKVYNDKRQRHKKWLEASFETCSTAMVLTDEDGIIRRTNAAWKTLTGFGDSECIGKTNKILQCPETNLLTFNPLFDTCRATGQSFTTTLLNQRKNGERFVNQLTMHKVDNGFLAELRGLGSIEQRLASFVTATYDCIFETDLRGIVVECDESLDALVGTPMRGHSVCSFCPDFPLHLLQQEGPTHFTKAVLPSGTYLEMHAQHKQNTILVVVRDITANHKQASHAAVKESSVVALARMHPSTGNIAVANSLFCDIMDEPMDGKTFYSFVDAAHRDRVQRALNNEQWTTARIHTSNGMHTKLVRMKSARYQEWLDISMMDVTAIRSD